MYLLVALDGPLIFSGSLAWTWGIMWLSTGSRLSQTMILATQATAPTSFLSVPLHVLPSSYFRRDQPFLQSYNLKPVCFSQWKPLLLLLLL